MSMLDHLKPVPLIRRPVNAVSRSDIDAAFLKMVNAQVEYNDARKKWADYHPVCADLAKKLQQTKHDYIRMTATWFQQTAGRS